MVGYVGMNGLWLDRDSVDVLVKALEQISEELLSILLTVANKSWGKSLYLGLERWGVHHMITADLPQLVYNLAEGLDQGSFHARRCRVYVGHVLLVQQVLQQRSRVAQTLDHAVHKTLERAIWVTFHILIYVWQICDNILAIFQGHYIELTVFPIFRRPFRPQRSSRCVCNLPQEVRDVGLPSWKRKKLQVNIGTFFPRIPVLSVNHVFRSLSRVQA